MRILRHQLAANEAASVLRLAGERDPPPFSPCPTSPSLPSPVTNAVLHAARAAVAHTMRGEEKEGDFGETGNGDTRKPEVRARDMSALAQLEEAAAAAVEEPVIVSGRARK